MANEIKRIAVFTSGGDSPGMNAAVRAVVRTATYHDLHVYRINRGYSGMIAGEIERIETKDVGNIIHRGGTILKTSRSEEFLTKKGRQIAFDKLNAFDIDACVAIGGNGTFTGAEIFTKEFDIPFVGIPGTIDNDLYGTDYTIGFDTSINTAIEAVDRIRDTADSHNRLFFIEVMGRHAGFIALATGIGSGAETILVPESKTSEEEIIATLKKGVDRKKLFSVIIVAEGSSFGGAHQIAEKVGSVIGKHKTRVAVIGHLQRGGAPSAADRMLASRLGYGAVNALLEGQSNIMIGVQNDKLEYVPFSDAINKTKPLNEDILKMAEILAQ
mgnify:CR=1 FL=1